MGMPLSDDELKAQWHSTLNLPVTFETIEDKKYKYSWVGSTCGHIYKNSLINRRAGSGCLYCAGKAILIGFNDFESQNPEIAKEWHPTKNLPLLPSQIFSRGSSQKYTWVCSRGHEYEAKPLTRASGHGCGYCSGAFPIVGETDLATTHPKLVAKYWNYAKNGSVLPSHVKAGSSVSAWWLCSEGHDTYGSIADKVDKNVNCKYCSN